MGKSRAQNGISKPRVSTVASYGQAIGQLVGDWFEKYFAYPIFVDVSSSLSLDLQSRFAPGWNGKVVWKDLNGNEVDYDFALTLPERPVPVAFFETFWRKRAGHSKDKARDDSTKLIPMRLTYPTARVLGVLAAGEFTKPAQEFVRSNHIQLFSVSKTDVVHVWADAGFNFDYPSKTPESTKQEVYQSLLPAVKSEATLEEMGKTLRDRVGAEVLASLRDGIVERLASPPELVSLFELRRSSALTFDSFAQAEDLILNGKPPTWSKSGSDVRYGYRVDFASGDPFVRDGLNWSEVAELHAQLGRLERHMELQSVRPGRKSVG